ncbi:cellulose synthase catalytic subunit [Planotetraspora sp. A-T 1434]|uniref:glycosyltransferase family 2 protein n=1 Tax=Planotetraspora sp. A-T 1434 TaxID=2979219 RepID=UPI0021C190D8|nr:cellulose synthase catalytic subunit [Planotetraspora sp. A-T 1434]MCT9933785.1 cellulose synthase catalytic subunit [Planotetraspora sp. A-T 1434]
MSAAPRARRAPAAPPRSPAGHRANRQKNAYGLLPQPPDDREKDLYAKRNLWVLTLSSLVSFCCLVASQVQLAKSTPWLWVYVPFLVFTVVYYLISLRVNAFTPDFDLAGHRLLVRSWFPIIYPTVDVFLPVCGEPIEVLHNTWTHVRAMAGHYPGVVAVYVLDDSASAELAAMAADFGFTYGTRPNRGWYKKAGNLHYGFSRSNGEYILILDADFAPRHDLLDEMLPYMHRDPRIGIVQSPQYFRVLDSQNWVERGAGAVQELFYRSVQVSRQRNDGAICVGSCAVYRRAALAQNGGTTLIEHSEDVHTGFDLRRLGWDVKYIPIALSTGVCPDSIGAFQNQQYRWCTGSMSLLGSKKFRETKLRPATRLCYMSGFFYYVHTAVFTFAAPLIPITLLLAMPDKLRVEHLALVLPSILYTTLIFPLWHRAPYRLEAWAARMVYGWAHVFAIWDIVRGRQQGWQPTGSAGAKKNKTRRLWMGISVWGGGTALLWVAAAVWRMATMYAPDYALVLASGLFYALIVGRVLVQPRQGDPA